MPHEEAQSVPSATCTPDWSSKGAHNQNSLLNSGLEDKAPFPAEGDDTVGPECVKPKRLINRLGWLKDFV